jgi:Flp pilus assembly protein TadG
MKKSRRERCRGGGVLETAMMMPWLIFLFVGGFDWGYYAHALISTETAARVAVINASKSAGDAIDTSSVCKLAVEELKIAPNVATAQACGATQSVNVTTSLLTTASADQTLAAQVTVTYTTVTLIPIPGLLKGRATITRKAQMKLRG